MNIETVQITTAMIHLDQFLKWAAIAETGGHAKELIAAGVIRVNGEIAHERRKKIYPGDMVAMENGGTWKVTSDKARPASDEV